MNVCNGVIVHVTVHSRQLGIFSDPVRDSYFGKYNKNFVGEYKIDKWSHHNDNNVVYDLWISFTRRKFSINKKIKKINFFFTKMTINNKHMGFGPAVIIDDRHTYIFLFDSYKDCLQEWGTTKSWKYDWTKMTQDHYKMAVKEMCR